MVWSGAIRNVPELMSPDGPGAQPYSGGGSPVIPIPTLAVGNTTVNGQFGPAPGLTAAQSVNIYLAFLLTQTTAGITITPPNPTGGTDAATVVYVFESSASSTQTYTMLGASVPPGGAIMAVWNGDNYTVIGTSGGAVLLTTLAVGDTPVAGNIGALTAAASVDLYSAFTCAQTTAARTLTLPNPTNTTATRLAYVENTGTASFLIHGITLCPSCSALFAWNGTAWTPSGFGVSPTLGVGIGTQTPVAGAWGLDMVGAQVLRGVTITDRAAGGAIGTAGATVDISSGAFVSQTTVGQDLTIPSPTAPLNSTGRLFWLQNVGTAVFTCNRVTIGPAQCGWFVYNALGAWTPVSASPVFTRTSQVSTSPYAPQLGEQVNVNTSGGAITVNLPAITSASKGQIIAISMYAAANFNTCTITAAAGTTIDNGAVAGSVQLNGQADVILQVDESGNNWAVLAWSGCPAVGANLTDAAATSGRLARVTQYVLPAATLTADRTNTLSTTNAHAGDLIIITRLDLTAFRYTVAGATSVVLPPFNQGFCIFQFNGTNWQPYQMGSTFPAPSFVDASNTSAQSIPNNSATTITGWTATSNIGGAFVAATGIYTTPAAGKLRVTANTAYVACVNPPLNGEWRLSLNVAAAIVRTQKMICQVAAAAITASVGLACSVQVTSGQTVVLQAFQNSGAAVLLTATAVENFVEFEMS